MIQNESRLKVADNTGAREILVIRIMGGSKRKTATVGDIVIGTVKSATPQGSVKKSEIVRAVVVRTAKEYRRGDGSYIKFDDNAAVILQGETKGPTGHPYLWAGRTRAARKGFMKIVSLAPETL